MPLVLMAAQRFPNPFVKVRVLGGMPVLGYMQQRLNRHVGSIPTPRFMRSSLNGRATASQPSKKVSCYFYRFRIMDNTLVCGISNRGSIPLGGTNFMVDVVYRLAPESVKLLERVRIPSSTPVFSRIV